MESRKEVRLEDPFRKLSAKEIIQKEIIQGHFPELKNLSFMVKRITEQTTNITD